MSRACDPHLPSAGLGESTTRRIGSHAAPAAKGSSSQISLFCHLPSLSIMILALHFLDSVLFQRNLFKMIESSTTVGKSKNPAWPNKLCPSWVCSSCDGHVLSKHYPGHSGAKEGDELHSPRREAHHRPLGEGGPHHQPRNGPLPRVHQGGGRGGDFHFAGKSMKNTADWTLAAMPG